MGPGTRLVGTVVGSHLESDSAIVTTVSLHCEQHQGPQKYQQMATFDCQFSPALLVVVAIKRNRPLPQQYFRVRRIGFGGLQHVTSLYVLLSLAYRVGASIGLAPTFRHWH